MKTKPINFKPEAIQALKAGDKTQDRRILKSQPIEQVKYAGYGEEENQHFWEYLNEETPAEKYLAFDSPCPYGKVGDYLWVREAYRTIYTNGKLYDIYKADAQPNLGVWQPSSVMPRWASRFTLKITHIRVERLSNISEEDAIAEGYVNKTEYSESWKSTNGKNSWDANPWVWVISFEVIERNIDDVLKNEQ